MEVPSPLPPPYDRRYNPSPQGPPRYTRLVPYEEIRVGKVYFFSEDRRAIKVTKIEKSDDILHVHGDVLWSGHRSDKTASYLLDRKQKDGIVWEAEPDPEPDPTPAARPTTSSSPTTKAITSSSAGTPAIAITFGVLAVNIGLLVAFINAQTK